MPLSRAALANNLLDPTQLLQRFEHEYLLTGIKQIDLILKGLSRGAITEVYGSATTGKTSLLQGFLTHATAKGEFFALVDSQDSFDPVSAARVGADLQKLLWVRCHQPEESVQAADLLLHSGGWGIVALDLSGVPIHWLAQLPLSYWYRLRRTVESTPTVFLVLTTQPTLKTCATMLLEMKASPASWSGHFPDFKRLTGTHPSLKARKPFQRGSADFEVKATA